CGAHARGLHGWGPIMGFTHDGDGKDFREPRGIRVSWLAAAPARWARRARADENRRASAPECGGRTGAGRFVGRDRVALGDDRRRSGSGIRCVVPGAIRAAVIQ
ncbi:MAG TPA: hypothetical protein QGF05_13160, partial [Dehalococcoidia bacterium]|nr:hypothetical protein [Dehalococcoidia bacterium]